MAPAIAVRSLLVRHSGTMNATRMSARMILSAVKVRYCCIPGVVAPVVHAAVSAERVVSAVRAVSPAQLAATRFDQTVSRPACRI